MLELHNLLAVLFKLAKSRRRSRRTIASLSSLGGKSQTVSMSLELSLFPYPRTPSPPRSYVQVLRETRTWNLSGRTSFNGDGAPNFVFAFVLREKSFVVNVLSLKFPSCVAGAPLSPPSPKRDAVWLLFFVEGKIGCDNFGG